MKRVKENILRELKNLSESWKDEPMLGDWSNGYKNGVASTLKLVLECIKEEEDGRP